MVGLVGCATQTQTQNAYADADRGRRISQVDGVEVFELCGRVPSFCAVFWQMKRQSSPKNGCCSRACGHAAWTPQCNAVGGIPPGEHACSGKQKIASQGE